MREEGLEAGLSSRSRAKRFGNGPTFAIETLHDVVAGVLVGVLAGVGSFVLMRSLSWATSLRLANGWAVVAAPVGRVRVGDDQPQSRWYGDERNEFCSRRDLRSARRGSTVAYDRVDVGGSNRHAAIRWLRHALTSVAASFVGDAAARGLGLKHESYAHVAMAQSAHVWLSVVLVGVSSGLCAVVFIEGNHGLRGLMVRYVKTSGGRLAIGG